MLKKVGKWLGSCMGYLLYTLALLLLLLWVFFPQEPLRRLLVQYLNNASPGLSWQVQAITLQVPEGIIVAGIKGYGAQDKNQPLVQVDSLCLWPHIPGMLHTRRPRAGYRLLMAQGVVAGTLQRNGGKTGLHVDGSMQGLQLAECPLLPLLLQRNPQGVVSADFAGIIEFSLGKISDLEAKLRVDNGLLDLKRPILNHGSLPFSQISFTLRSSGATIQLEQGLVDSELFSGQFAGAIQLSRDPGASRIDIKGTLQPRPPFYEGMNNTPVLESIRSQLENRSLPFLLSGDLNNPGIHFEEFSLLFLSLEKELQ